MRVITIIAALAIAIAAKADSIPELRAVTSSYTVEAGTAHLADTYLSPMHYRGDHMALRYERAQAMRFDPDRWTMQIKLGALVDRTHNPAGNATMLNALFEGSWGMMRRYSLPGGVTLGVGPAIEANAGTLYLGRNSNNPASAKAAVTVDATAFASWRHHLGKLDFTLRYQPTLPVTGIFFSPDYGQLYYQMWLGHTGQLVYPAWWGNYFAMDNLVTADLHFGNTSLRLGYHNTILSTKVNNLVTRDISHALVVGITTEWISLRPDSRNIDARIISAY